MTWVMATDDEPLDLEAIERLCAGGAYRDRVHDVRALIAEVKRLRAENRHLTEEWRFTTTRLEAAKETLADETARANAAEAALATSRQENNRDWTLAFAAAVGMHSGLKAPLLPEALGDCLRAALEVLRTDVAAICQCGNGKTSHASGVSECHGRDELGQPCPCVKYVPTPTDRERVRRRARRALKGEG